MKKDTSRNHAELTKSLRDLQAWSERKGPFIRATAGKIAKNLRRLKRYPTDRELLVQTAKNVAALSRALAANP